MERKPKGSGSVRQRSNGTWEARCMLNGKMQSFYGKKQADVIKAMRSAQTKADEGRHFEPARVSLSSWLDTWISEYIEPSAKPLTVATYKSRIESHIKPNIGDIKLSALNPTQIQRFYNDLVRLKDLSPKTVKNIHGILHKALEQAIKLQYILVNPCEACTLPRIIKKEIKPLTEQECTRFLEEAENSTLYNLFMVAMFTGMREGEICGLPWDAINIRDETITIKQQLLKEKKKGGQHYIDSPKNDRTRVITIPPFIIDILKKIKKQQSADNLIFGFEYKNEFNLVFTDPMGNFIKPQTALKTFKRIATKIGRPDARFHDLRHTYAVNALQEGDDVKTVQQNLGHATASFTLDVYGHVSEKMKKESAARMQTYFEKIKA